MSSWGCPHENNGACTKVNNLPCDPGMRGCVLHGRYTFANPAKNRPRPESAPGPKPERATPPAKD